MIQSQDALDLHPHSLVCVHWNVEMLVSDSISYIVFPTQALSEETNFCHHSSYFPGECINDGRAARNHSVLFLACITGGSLLPEHTESRHALQTGVIDEVKYYFVMGNFEVMWTVHRYHLHRENAAIAASFNSRKMTVPICCTYCVPLQHSILAKVYIELACEFPLFYSNSVILLLYRCGRWYNAG